MSKFMFGFAVGVTCWTVVLYYSYKLQMSQIDGEITLKNEELYNLIDAKVTEEIKRKLNV